VVGGYYQVFDHVLRTAQQNANVVGPLYGHAVTEIDWTAVAAASPEEPVSVATSLDTLGAALAASLPSSSGNAQVVVRCANGAEFRADRVLVTIPHAVLKHQPPALVFTPPLPPPMRAAIEHVHAGLMNLVVLWYPHFFWPLEYNFFGVARDDRREPLEFSTFLSPKILDQRGERVPILMCAAKLNSICSGLDCLDILGLLIALHCRCSHFAVVKWSIRLAKALNRASKPTWPRRPLLFCVACFIQFLPLAQVPALILVSMQLPPPVPLLRPPFRRFPTRSVAACRRGAVTHLRAARGPPCHPYPARLCPVTAVIPQPPLHLSLHLHPPLTPMSLWSAPMCAPPWRSISDRDASFSPASIRTQTIAARCMAHTGRACAKRSGLPRLSREWCLTCSTLPVVLTCVV
jgi:hypothetical protein